MRLRSRLLLCIALLMIGLTQPVPVAAANSEWPMWGYNLSNHRYNPNETIITPANVQKLRVRWTFAFPNTGIASNQPTVIGDTAYVGSWNGSVYALDVATGKVRWEFSNNITGHIGSIRVGLLVTKDLVLFGDQLGRFFAVSRNNGTLIWIQQEIGKHPLAQITGSPILYGDRVYVPMASREENAAAEADYTCCTFRGSLTALNINDGAIAWQFHTSEEPKPRGTTSAGVKLYGPAGGGIWSTPAIDPEEGLIYVSTGNSYAPPASQYSNAILAINLKDGTLRWANQRTPDSWSNHGCDHATAEPNCLGAGPDVGFGSAPLLFTVQTANGSRKLVAAEQKNGKLHALDARTGEVVWMQDVGQQTAHPWGAAYDGKRIYITDNTYAKNGGVYALDPTTGKVVWKIGAMPCTPGPEQPASACWSGYMAAATSTPGLLWIGAMDGQMRAVDSGTGKVLWTYNTAQIITGDNGVAGRGGSIGPTNATIAGGQVYVMSGYSKWNERHLGGNVLYVFGLDESRSEGEGEIF
jgi:polyvinyl alcohol dehydrogenase (cytochrome)